jgi:DNA-binding MarR family transcriptional regulator
MGYLTQERSQHDKRSVTVKLTDKAHAVVAQVKALEDHNAKAFSEYIDEPKVEEVCQALQRLERTWADYIHYGTD